MTFHDWINNIIWKYFTNNKSGLIFKELTKEFRIVHKMTENKRFRIYQDLYEDFYIEDIESYNNQKLQRSYKVGNEEDVKYENVENIVDLLNEQEETINELKQRNQRQYERLKELTELMYERQWGKLENMVGEWEKADELLEQEWGTYCENK